MKPVFEISLDGSSIPINDRLISLEITDQADTTSDQLSMNIADPDNAIALPRKGVELTAFIGYEHSGLVNKGTFIVDEVEYSSPPNVLTIRARAANFRSNFKEIRQQSYHETTLGFVLSIICNRASLTLSISNELASIKIKHIDQTTSDSQFMAELGFLYDATATVKQGRMVFTPKGGGAKVDGSALPSAVIDQNECTSWRLTATDREHEVTGIKARYLNRAKSIEETILIGTNEITITLSKGYPTKDEAEAAAKADLKRRKRSGQQISLNLSHGKPELIAEQPITLTGFKPDIDGEWIVEEITHTLDSGGLSSRIELGIKE